jgi:hypothetical protein
MLYVFADFMKFKVRNQAWVRKSQIHELQFRKSQKKIGSANRKSSKGPHLQKVRNSKKLFRSENLHIFNLGTYLWKSHL